ncbi:MAG: S9 family peptidase [Ignavibacterium sp.]|jgi:dipeptidyl aminopeptidase/acylaminoacyl peptidase
MKRKAAVLVMMIAAGTLAAQQKRPITFDDLIGMIRIADPQISPDGKTVVFVGTRYDKVANNSSSALYRVPVDGGPVEQLTTAPKANHSPRWMPDGSSLVFVSTRDGESQVWSMPAGGGDAKKLSVLSTGASGIVLSRDGKLIAFASEVYPDCPTDDCNKQREEERSASKVKAKVFDRLPYRIWNTWKDGKRSHVFVMSSVGGQANDMTPGDYDTPPIDLGGRWDYDFSPDGRELAFTRNMDPNIAISTNNDIFTVPVEGGTVKRMTDNPANDSQPLYSPDGAYLAYRRMERAGFEADRRRLVLIDRKTGRHRSLTDDFDYSVDDVIWAPDSKSLYITADDKGNKTVFRVWVSRKKIDTILTGGYYGSVRVTPDGSTLVFIKETINQPAELYRSDANGRNVRRLTGMNDVIVSTLDMNPKEDYWFKGAGGTDVHGWIVRPPGFQSGKKYPLVYLVHGGPQGQWGDQFHYRWSAQMFASRGYVVLMVNPRGSTGYGQTFTDEITRDWGGKVYDDLMAGLDAALGKFPFIDGARVAAAGASYGGYMMNWMAGSTTRFTCFVSHDGVFNPWSMYGTTEELWFPEWEFGGTPYQNPDLYDRWSPLKKAANFKTPVLVIHGQLDYRVDVSEGFQLFTALQRQGVKSKMLYFPDEGHWVMKPANAELWYQTVLDWIDEHTGLK